MNIEETTLTVYTVGNRQFASRAEALAAAAEAATAALVERYIEESGAGGRNATRTRNALTHWERWKAQQQG